MMRYGDVRGNGALSLSSRRSCQYRHHSLHVFTVVKMAAVSSGRHALLRINGDRHEFGHEMHESESIYKD